MIGDKTEPRRYEEREENIMDTKESPSRHSKNFAVKKLTTRKRETTENAMHTKSVRLIGSGVALVLAIVILACGPRPAIAHAQSPAQTASSSSCIACHESQYYLYDTGRWYCMTEAKERCVNCHAGNANSTAKQEAHTGLISNPLGDGIARCETCHTQDAEALAREVIAHTGSHAITKTEPYIPDTIVSGFPEALQPSNGSPSWPWLIPTVIVVFGFWLFLVTRANRM
jgi:hypothetical protein